MSLSFHLQVLCSAMVVREDADIGWVVVGDLHKRSTCAQLRLGDAVEVLASLRRIQLGLLYTGVGLQDPTDDIADDVAATRALVGEFATSIQGGGSQPLKGFVAEVQDAMTLEGHAGVPPSSQKQIGCPDSCTDDKTDTGKEVPLTPMKTLSSAAPISPDGLLCTMHAKSPCTPTDLNRRLTTGPWFQRTPTLSLASAKPAISVTRRLELPPVPTLGGDNSLSSTERVCVKDVSCVSEHVEGLGIKHAKRKVASTPLDESQDDVISRTTQKTDGR